MAFKFKLASILEHRKRNEALAKKDFADAVYHLMKEKKRLGSHHHELESSYSFIEGLFMNNTVLMNEIRLAENYVQFIKKKISHQEGIIANLSKIVEGKRKLVLKATQEKKILEKLEQKHKSEYLKQGRKKEAILMDEMAQNKKLNFIGAEQ